MGTPDQLGAKDLKRTKRIGNFTHALLTKAVRELHEFRPLAASKSFEGSELSCFWEAVLVLHDPRGHAHLLD